MLIRCLRCRPSDISMTNSTTQGQRRRPRKRSKKRRRKGHQKILTLSLVAIAVVVVVLFLIALGLDPTIGAVICMLTLAVIFYLITTSQPKPRKRRAKRKREVQASEPQFYTALPSSLGLTEIPEEPPRPQIKLPPRPIRAARRRRDFITYPVAVGGGNYSDSYVQVDKDTVLRLRSEMAPVSETKHLPGLRIDTFPPSKIAAVMSQKVTQSVAPVVAEVAEAIPVVAEPVVASTETPVVQSVVAQEEEEEEEEEEMEFDMEWD